MEKDSLWELWEVGKELGVSTVFVTKELIFNYANAVEDYDPIFLNPSDAEKAGFGGIVAPPSFHAQFTYMKWAIGDKGWLSQGTVHVRQELKFRGLVREGDQLFIRVKAGNKFKKNGKKFVELEIIVDNQKKENLCIGKSVFLLPS